MPAPTASLVNNFLRCPTLCKHPKNKLLFNVPHFSFPLLFIVCCPGFWGYNQACLAFVCEDKKTYLAVIATFAVFAMACSCPLIFT